MNLQKGRNPGDLRIEKSWYVELYAQGYVVPIGPPTDESHSADGIQEEFARAHGQGGGERLLRSHLKGAV